MARDLPPNFHAQEHGGIEPQHDIMLAPARSVLPLLRWPLGYRMVHPFRMLPVVLFMSIAPYFTWALYAGFIPRTKQLPDNIGQIYLVYFAAICFAASLIVFARRWYGQRKGESIHTLEAGYSWLTWFTPLPVWLSDMFIVPLAVGMLGWGIDRTFSVNLGMWLMLCGCSLFGLAFWERRRIWSQQRSAIDENARAKSYEARFSRTEQKQSKSEPVIAELGKDLRSMPLRGSRAKEVLDQQRGNIGAASSAGDAPAKDGDDPFF